MHPKANEEIDSTQRLPVITVLDTRGRGNICIQTDLAPAAGSAVREGRQGLVMTFIMSLECWGHPHKYIMPSYFINLILVLNFNVSFKLIYKLNLVKKLTEQFVLIDFGWAFWMSLPISQTGKTEKTFWSMRLSKKWCGQMTSQNCFRKRDFPFLQYLCHTPIMQTYCTLQNDGRILNTAEE